MDLTHVPTLKKLLKRHGLAPTKKFGQHFLVSERVVESILSEATSPVKSLSPEGREVGERGFAHRPIPEFADNEGKGSEAVESILEVGPGPGVLTSRLSVHCELTAIEIDPIAVSALAESAPRARVLHADALKLDLSSLLEELPKPRVLVSNMPYNITGPLLTRFTECRPRFSRAVLMMQREVGDRVLAKTGSSDYGSLSVFLQSRFRISKLCDAPAGAFFPPPKVESVVLVFEPQDLVPEALDRAHQRLVRLAFTQPRKTLANNLNSAFGKEVLSAAVSELGLPLNVRPHQVSPAEFLRLAEILT